MTDASPILAVDGITKAYGPTVANDDVSFSVARGSVHALLGENGAGKSTTMKILSGLVRPDAGTILLDGVAVTFDAPARAHAAGIRTAFQELTLIPDLTVLENMQIPRGAVNALGILRRHETVRRVTAHLDDLGLEVDLHALARELTLAERQKVEIARALLNAPRILLLDEPTSSLSGRDVDWLGEVIAKAVADGTTVIFISHRLPEVRAFCDTLSILRNGRHVRSGRVADFTDDEVAELIIGRSIETVFPPREEGPESAARTPNLSVRDLAAGEKLRDVTFDLHPGEVLGIAGLQGMGQRDLFNALFGAERVRAGKITLDGLPLRLTSPADALDASVAIGLVPEERKTQGLFLRLTGSENAALPVLPRLSRFGLVDADRERLATAAAFDAVEVDTRAHYMTAGSFSGGNQQKIAIAKWFVAQSRILLLFDPTRGIDVGTKHQLYALIRAFADAGGSVLLYSTEIPELVHLSDRLGIVYEGRIGTWLDGADITEEKVLDATLGGLSTGIARARETAA